MRFKIENGLLVVLSAAIFFKITDAILICPLSLLKCPVCYHNACSSYLMAVLCLITSYDCRREGYVGR